MLKFFSALIILLLAIFLQLFFASVSWYFNLTLAALIAFASVFDFWELLTLDLLAVFILNWKPAPSVVLLAFALIPLAALVFRKFVNSQLWIGNLIAIITGFLVFYFIAAPTIFFINLFPFLIDLVMGLLVGEAVLFTLT